MGGSFPQLLQLLFFNFPATSQEERDCGREVQDFKSFKGCRQEMESPGKGRAGDKVPLSRAVRNGWVWGQRGRSPPKKKVTYVPWNEPLPSVIAGSWKELRNGSLCVMGTTAPGGQGWGW